MEQIEANVYTFDVENFDASFFETMMIEAMRSFFLDGVTINDVRYFISYETGHAERGEGAHMPSDFHIGNLMIWVGYVAQDNAIDSVYDIESQCFLIDHLQSVFHIPVKGELILCTFNHSKLEQYIDVMEGYEELTFGTNMSDDDSVMGTGETMAINKLILPEISDQIMIADQYSLEFEALGGNPGPYVKNFLSRCPPIQLDQILTKLNNFNVVIELSVAMRYITLHKPMIDTCIVRMKGIWVCGSNVRNNEFASCIEVRGILLSKYRVNPLLKIALWWLFYNYRKRRRSVLKKVSATILL